MSMLDSVLKQVSGSPDTVASLAEQVGLDSSMVEKAVAALGQSHPESGDTVELAAQKTGIDAGALGGIVSQLGGENALGELSGLMDGNVEMADVAKLLDRDGDGNPLNDVMGMAKGLFGKK